MRGLFCPPDGALHALYTDLVAIYGEQPWWPAETPFEVVVGAVLTQNAAWSNVEKAIVNLKAAGMLSLAAILDSSHESLAQSIRPSGYFNVKAQRLRNLCEFVGGEGGLGAFARQPLDRQRAGLLGVKGIGPETADDILLYAFDRPVFVIDAYTRRLFTRLGRFAGDEGYEHLRAEFERALGPDVALYNEYHALVVRHAKQACRKRPQCGGCRLRGLCPRGPGRPPPGPWP